MYINISFYFRQETEETKRRTNPFPPPCFSIINSSFSFYFVPRHAGIKEIPSAPVAFVRWATSGKTWGSSPGQPVLKRAEEPAHSIDQPQGPKIHQTLFEQHRV